MNASDFVVTVAIGSTVAATALDPNVSRATGLTAIAMLIEIQYTTVLISARASSLRGRIEGQPILLVQKGRVLTDMMRRSNIGDIELHQALREHGLASIDEAEAVVLEANGDFSIIARRENRRQDLPVLRDVRRP